MQMRSMITRLLLFCMFLHVFIDLGIPVQQVMGAERQDSVLGADESVTSQVYSETGPSEDVGFNEPEIPNNSSGDTGGEIREDGEPFSNLLSNAGFEHHEYGEAAADGWMSYVSAGAESGISVIETGTVSGSRAQHVAGSGLGDQDVAMILQSVAVNGGRQYEVSGQFNVHSLENSKVQLYVDFYDEAGQFVGVEAAELTEPTDGYRELKFSRVTPATAAKAKVHAILRGVGGEGSGSFDVDDMRLEYANDTAAPTAPSNLYAAEVTATSVGNKRTTGLDGSDGQCRGYSL